jgi:DNA-binding Lrp family transcriptional regulator
MAVSLTMDPLIHLLSINSHRSSSELARELKCPEEEVRARIATAEADGTILGYHAVVDQQKAGQRGVTALIEVKITPEREGGFDRLARRIAQFDQVRECFLMSGGYDLAVIVEGKDLLDVANFVAEKLSTIGGVISTATHFQLKAYKQAGFVTRGSIDEERLPITP